jgi:hypothetical protein
MEQKRPKIGRSIYVPFASWEHFLKGGLVDLTHTVFVWSCRMRTDRDPSSAYPVPAGSIVLGVWPHAGSGIAYRLAKLTAPRSGVVALIAAMFYFL